ncbi:MFS transporter [Arthrobacter sp. B6]|uniref:MFS transporter n=1 Tax=Arthrobacter sp. B6 TaxID=1570137 RepID=UPI0008294EC1|nr:MFS transporter [Arthrobacter sp. B6]
MKNSVETEPHKSQKRSPKYIVAGAIGHVMEWFDFAIYAYAAPVISRHFFPSDDVLTSLMSTFAVFAVGFIARPLGGLVMGVLGDRIGSTKVLSLCVIMMAGATVFMGLLPTYEMIGFWAPVLLVMARLLQGFAVGGEIGSAASFLVEFAPPHRRGFYGSWTQQSAAVGLLLASLVFTALSVTLSEEALNSWGWRVPFVASVLLAIFGFYLRRSMPNTPKFENLVETEGIVKKPLTVVLRENGGAVIRAIGIIVCFTIGFYFIFTFLPSYIRVVVESSYSASFGSSVIGLSVFAVILPFLGHLSDKIGRKSLMICSYVGFIALPYPLLKLIETGSFPLMVVGQVGFVLVLALVAAPLMTALAELFRTSVRNSAVSVSYNLCVAALGGTAPMVATYLSSLEGSPEVYLAMYLGAAGIVSLLSIWTMKDRHKEPLA